MPTKITIPRLGWSMEEGTFEGWIKSPGEFVQAGDMLYLLEGDKATQEIESFDAGVLCVPGDAPSPGTKVKVGETIGFLLARGEAPPTTVGPRPTSPPKSDSPPAGAPSVSQPVPSGIAPPPLPRGVASGPPRAAGPAARRLARQLGVDLNAVFTPDPTGRVLDGDVRRAAHAGQHASSVVAGRAIATPRARRRASELGVDWTRIRGTGRGGRVRERDVLSPKAVRLADDQAASFQEPAPIVPGRHKPATKLRMTIAQRMLAGVTQAAPVTLTMKVDADPLIAYRAILKAASAGNIVPSYNDILIRLSAQTLREHPALNACWHRDGIHLYESVHIATAVDTDAGLLAPVIRDADKLTVAEIAAQTRELIEKGRAARLTQQQLEGGTFTVSNLGMFGIDAFTPILSPMQAGILGVGRIVEEPVVRDGRLAVGHTLTLSLTFDHRVIDGAPAARWLQRLCHRVASLTA
jgi:pyruvate dehydrogenase E2 component (dihydrolipoamide acetyltransferase)